MSDNNYDANGNRIQNNTNTTNSNSGDTASRPGFNAPIFSTVLGIYLFGAVLYLLSKTDIVKDPRRKSQLASAAVLFALIPSFVSSVLATTGSADLWKAKMDATNNSIDSVKTIRNNFNFTAANSGALGLFILIFIGGNVMELKR
jgi:hypothetical protein